MREKQIRQVAFGCVLACAGSAALADWTFNKPDIQSNYASVTSTGEPIAATASAFSVANNMTTQQANSNSLSRTVTDSGAFGSGAVFAAASLTGNGASGLGVLHNKEVDSSPNHAVDSWNNTDMIMFSFGAGNAFTLDKVKLGWVERDADITLLRYIGSGAPVMDGTKTWDAMKNDGWQVVQNFNYTGGSSSNVVLDVNNNGLSSSWWIVSAFNTSFGAGVDTANSTGANSGRQDTYTRTSKYSDKWNWANTPYNKADYFKLAGLVGTIAPPESNGVPEPGSLALLGVAVLGMLATRRRIKTQH